MMNFQHSWLDQNETRLNLKVEGKLLFGKFQDLQSFIFDLKETPPAHITFDLQMVDMIDSSGLGLLIVANEITGQNGNVTLKHPTEQVRQLFQVCKIDEIMEVVT